MMDHATRIAQITAALDADERSAFEAGLDAGRHGATPENCHIRNFARRQLTEAWERGQVLGLKERAMAGSGGRR